MWIGVGHKDSVQSSPFTGWMWWSRWATPAQSLADPWCRLSLPPLEHPSLGSRCCLRVSPHLRLKGSLLTTLHLQKPILAPCPALLTQPLSEVQAESTTPFPTLVLRSFTGMPTLVSLWPQHPKEFEESLPSQFSLKTGWSQETNQKSHSTQNCSSLRGVLTRASSPGWFLMLPPDGFSIRHLSTSSPYTFEPSLSTRWDQPALEWLPSPSSVRPPNWVRWNIMGSSKCSLTWTWTAL